MDLKELILSCGEQFHDLTKVPFGPKQPYEWKASYTKFATGGVIFDDDFGVMQSLGEIEAMYEGRGHTPEEAVQALKAQLPSKNKE